MPIGNLTSQLFANIYLNEFDQFVKHELKVKYYFRYTDDFIIVSADRVYLMNILLMIKDFLETELGLQLHPNKLSIRKFSQGIDFLGYVLLPYYHVLRVKTKKRILKNINKKVADYKSGEVNYSKLNQVLQSYAGVFSHADCYKLEKKLLNDLLVDLSAD